MAQGYLQVDVVSDVNSFPVQDADVAIARTEEPDKIIEETRTNSSGQTENLSLDAPPPELSLSPEETERPYAEYTIRIIRSMGIIFQKSRRVRSNRSRKQERSYSPELLSHRPSWCMTAHRPMRLHRTIMFLTVITSKMWLPVRSMRRGRVLRSLRMCWRSCPSR